MRAIAYVVATFVPLAAASAFAHGPQIQVTDDGGKIVTRQLIADAPYGAADVAKERVRDANSTIGQRQQFDRLLDRDAQRRD